MTMLKTVFTVLLAVFAGLSQVINIRGKVTDTSGVTPIVGAVVKLEKYGFTDTTIPDGSFVLTGNVSVKFNVNQLLSSMLSVRAGNGMLYVHVRERLAIEIITYTIAGKVVSRVQKVMGIGTHSITQPNMGNGVYLYKIKAGNKEFVIKSPSIGRRAISAITGTMGISTATLSRVNSYFPIDDVIAITKEGYLNYRVIVTNSDTSNINIKMITCEDTVTDADGNVYQAVKIGHQVWTIENLKTTKYNDGTPVTFTSSTATWANATTEKYCYYKNATNTDSIKKYGALYNWYAINTKKLTPIGWHVPTDADWDTLHIYLIVNGYNWDGTTTGNKVAKSLAMKVFWSSSTELGVIGNDLTANNKSGFSAIPGGYRNNNGIFANINNNGTWWSASEIDTSNAYARRLYYGVTKQDAGLYRSMLLKSCGFSVRLLSD